jgi:chorismate synthase
MRKIRFLTAGESHGPSLTGIIDGIPAGLELSPDDFSFDMKRRRWGIGRSKRMSVENDTVEILSGVRFGKTTGAPITLKIENQSFEKSYKDDLSKVDKSSQELVTVPRPGHADYAGARKFALDDIRDVIERASARETAIRVAFGVTAKKFLSLFDLNIISRPLQIGDVSFNYENEIPTSKSLSGDGLEAMFDEASAKYAEMTESLLNLRSKLESSGDTAGGTFQIIAHRVPMGLGSYSQADLRLNASLASAIISIPSVKACSFGVSLNHQIHSGSHYHDEFELDERQIIRKTNNAGGIEGGISNGEPVIISADLKPIPTMNAPIQSVDLKTGDLCESRYENADLWVVEAAGVIGEAVIALELMDEFMMKFGGDSVNEIQKRLKD